MSASKASRVFIGKIPWTVGKRELVKYCSQFGRVSAANVIFDRETGLHKGYGFVSFSTSDGLVNITKESTHFLEGGFLTVQLENQRNRE